MGIQQASCPAGAHLHAALHRVAAHTCPSAKNASVACVSLQVGETGLNRKPDRLVNNHKTPQTPQTRMSSPSNALIRNLRQRKHPQLRKKCSKRAFPRPAHMHAHEASERADTHTFPTRKQARHLPDILCCLTRAHDHRSAHAVARKQGAQNREVATAAFPTARTAQKHAGIALRTLRYLPGGCLAGRGSVRSVDPRIGVTPAPHFPPVLPIFPFAPVGISFWYVGLYWTLELGLGPTSRLLDIFTASSK
jgi:hypothetical protein